MNHLGMRLQNSSFYLCDEINCKSITLEQLHYHKPLSNTVPICRIFFKVTEINTSKIIDDTDSVSVN